MNQPVGALQELRLAIKAAFADWDRRLRDGSPGAARGLRTTLGSNGVTMCLSCDQPVTHPRNVPGSQPTVPDKGGQPGEPCVVGEVGGAGGVHLLKLMLGEAGAAGRAG